MPPWNAARQASLSFTISQSLLKIMSTESVMPSYHLILWCPSPPAFNLSKHEGLFQWVSSSYQVAKYWNFCILPINIHWYIQWIFRVDFLQDWLVWSPCSPRDPQDSQASSPAPQFKNINSSMLSLLYGPTLTTVHDYWKNHSFDYMNLCLQSDVSVFLIYSLGLSQLFFPKE